jgi:hypothetical protein
MDLPRRYSYNPKWRHIGGFLAAGAGVLALAAFRAPFWISVPPGAVLAAIGLLGTLRLLVFPRFLEVGRDAVLVPFGFLQSRIAKIAYADIESIQEFTFQRAPFLKIVAGGRAYEFSPKFHMDAAGFAEVREFLTSLPGPREKAAALRNRPGERGQYCFQCAYDGNGMIYGSNGEALWLIKTEHFNDRLPHPYGFFRLPDFVVYDRAGKELIRIKRERRFPAARFVMFEDGAPVCRISQRSLLLNKYRLDFVGQPKWTFHMPLFSVFFRGQSETGARVQVRLKTHNVWYAKVDADADSFRLAAAMAFIHRERLRCI